MGEKMPNVPELTQAVIDASFDKRLAHALKMYSTRGWLHDLMECVVGILDTHPMHKEAQRALMDYARPYIQSPVEDLRGHEELRDRVSAIYIQVAPIHAESNGCH